MLVASILPMVLIGGLIVTFWMVPRQLGIFLIDLLLLAVASLAEEVAFRGYPFQRLIEAIGPTLATIVSSLVFAGAHILNPGSSRASFMVTIFSSTASGSRGVGTLPGTPACASCLDCP